MEFNATTIIVAISFIIFTLIMNKILYEPIKKIVEKRDTYLEANKNEAEKNSTEAGKIIEDKNLKIKEAKKTSKEEVALNMGKAKELKNEAAHNKKTELGQKLEQRKNELQQEKFSIKGEMDNQAQILSDVIVSKLKGEANV